MAFSSCLLKKGRFFFLFFMLILLIPLFSQNVVYEVQKGDTLYSIARKNNTTVAKIAELNRLDANVSIKIGQKLKIPIVSGTPNQNNLLNQEWELYTIVKGDTLYSLAKRYGIAQEDLLRKNNLKDASFLILGKRIWIPKKGKKAPDKTEKELSDKKVASNKNVKDSNAFSFPSASVLPEMKGAAVFGPVQWPTTGKVFRLKGKVEGVVIESQKGADVYSISTGTVVWAAPFRGYGKMVVIQAKENYTYTYCCNDQIYVKVGDKVSNGVKIGTVGVGSHDKKAKLILLTHKGEKPIDPVKAPRQ